ncbi:DUF4279 domain-containing protein [Sulfurimonas sp. HSL-3221]|uniref:DUF4279 domain-containing protein n=1 Tax=Sulfurimonadaceae TaxID=2771471 RepID=UPI001E4F61FE|nr:DUF4279 domain-containing protein [Sulfurimonas sp. HSL-3221]UFS62753.1 DUF4279 domain-containing protein [Sulfurimonas sp. HSL-3221]
MYKNEVIVRLIISGALNDISEIAEKIHATKIWKVGDLKNEKGTIEYKTNGCEFSIQKKDILHVDSILHDLILHLTPQQEGVLSSLDTEKKLSIVVYSNDLMPSFSFTKESLEFLCSINAELDLDIYCMKE